VHIAALYGVETGVFGYDTCMQLQAFSCGSFDRRSLKHLTGVSTDQPGRCGSVTRPRTATRTTSKLLTYVTYLRPLHTCIPRAATDFN
jgi:hypothetical protein